MAKKTAPPARSSRPSQQKSKEEQWRKRMSAQARTGTPGMPVSSAAESAVIDAEDEMFQEATVAAAQPVAPRTGATSGVTRTTAASAAVQRRATATSRVSRGRPGMQNAMTIDQEMSYIKGDIRKLITLTLVCVLIIVALSFIIPQFVR